MKVISLFSGIGGLDLGFIKSGFEIGWSNDSDLNVESTYCKNIQTDCFDNRKFEHIPFSQIPDKPLGIITGMPGLGWSISGNIRGLNDRPEQNIFDFIRLISKKKPVFFLIETLTGFVLKKNRQPLLLVFNLLEDLGYNISYGIIDAKNYSIAQERKRVYIVGLTKKINKIFSFPLPSHDRITMKDAIYDIRESAIKAKSNKQPNILKCNIPNHEYYDTEFSPHYMSRNRVRKWEEVSFTIQPDRRHIPLHPDSPEMIYKEKDKYIFSNNLLHLYRRLTIRECARLQSFEDNFILYYSSLNIGYSLIGNATPPKLAAEFARQIIKYL